MEVVIITSRNPNNIKSNHNPALGHGASCVVNYDVWQVDPRNRDSEWSAYSEIIDQATGVRISLDNYGRWSSEYNCLFIEEQIIKDTTRTAVEFGYQNVNHVRSEI